MRIVRDPKLLDLNRNESIGLVPTMGAFHDGHLQLMRRSIEDNRTTVVSLFVNPLQFGEGEDFSRYPRDESADAEMAKSVGVDVLFIPEVSAIYPNDRPTTIHVPVVTERWEGASRPGHFDGVSTVVAKLFNLVQPSVAYFGRKDFQQCAVVSRMVCDLNFPINLSVEPTIREPDGLALSSRNRFLSEENRRLAPAIFESLKECKRAILAEDNPAIASARAIAKLESRRIAVDYFAYVDDESLELLSEKRQGSTLICAARLGSTRLIDNIEVA